jgi:hypothetical protein
MHIRDRFRRRADFYDASIVGEQQISPAQDLSAFQNDSDLFAIGQTCAKTASAAKIKWQHELCIRGAWLEQTARNGQHGRSCCLA